MGILAYCMNVSLDLRIEQVPGDNGAGEWLRIALGVLWIFMAPSRLAFFETMIASMKLHESQPKGLQAHIWRKFIDGTQLAVFHFYLFISF